MQNGDSASSAVAPPASVEEPLLVDALPYIDEYGPSYQAIAEQLVKEEMKRFVPKKNYLAHLPVPTLRFADSPILKSEFERVSKGLPLPPINDAKYKIPAPPPELSEYYGAWKSAVDNARAQYEHQTLQGMNLELLLTYGANAWIAANTGLQGVKAQLQRELDAVRAEIEAVNRARKTEQTNAAPQLRHLASRFDELVYKNVHIELACRALEKEVEQLRVKAAENAPKQRQQQPQLTADGDQEMKDVSA